MLAVDGGATADPRMAWVRARAEDLGRHATAIDAAVSNSAIWQTNMAVTVATVRSLR